MKEHAPVPRKPYEQKFVMSEKAKVYEELAAYHNAKKGTPG